MTDQDQQDDRRRLRGRNLAMLAALLGFVILIYLVAIVKMAGS